MIAHEALEGLQTSEAEATTTPCSRFGQFVYSIGNRPVGECLPRSVQARPILKCRRIFLRRLADGLFVAGLRVLYAVRGTVLERFFASPRHCF
jgi:hypothetical protein